jgi:hypothetical protein
MVTTLLLATLILASNLANAADTKQSRESAMGMAGMGKTDMNRSMMKDSEMQGGMMDMMKGCGRMMSNPMMPELPAGNAKLQLQMRAEMMQKMGEILGRYADKIKDEKTGTP